MQGINFFSLPFHFAGVSNISGLTTIETGGFKREIMRNTSNIGKSNSTRMFFSHAIHVLNVFKCSPFLRYHAGITKSNKLIAEEWQKRAKLKVLGNSRPSEGRKRVGKRPFVKIEVFSVKNRFRGKSILIQAE